MKTILNKIRRWSLIFLAIIVIILGSCYSILRSDIFLLEEIVVKGNDRIPTEKILIVSEIQVGVDNIYSLSDDKTKQKLFQKFAYIKHINIKRKVPRTLIIEIIEKQPIVIIQFHIADRVLYGLIDIENFVLEITDTPESYPDMIILTDVFKESEAVHEVNNNPLTPLDNPPAPLWKGDKREARSHENTFLKSKDFGVDFNKEGKSTLTFPMFLDSFLASQFSKKLNKKAIQIAQNILKYILKRDKFSENQISTDLYSQILSINTKDTNKITLKLKNGSVVLLSSDYLEDGIDNFKTVFFYNKNRSYNYIDARFEGVVYCGEAPK